MASRLLQLIAPIKEEPKIAETQTTGSRLNLLLKSTQLQPVESKKVGVLDIVKGIPKAAVDIYKPLFEKTAEPLSAPTEQFIQKGKEFVSAIQESGSPAEKIGKGLSLGVAGVGVLFTPITAIFSAAEKVSILKPVTEALSLIFISAAITGEFAADRFLDILPINKENKDILRPAFEEVGGLAGMIWLGGKVMKELTEKKPITKEKIDLFKNEAKEVSKITQIPEAELPKFSTIFDVNRYIEKIKKEPEVAPASSFQTPREVVPMLKAEKGIIPQELQPIKSLIEPIKAKRKFIEVPREQLPVKMPEAEKGISALEARMKGFFETKNLEKAKVEAENLGLDFSVYDKMNKPEQLRMSAKYVEQTPQYKVLEVLEGKREAPKGLLHNAIMIALEAKSARDRNVDLAIKLASLRSTRMGQEISILTEVQGISHVSGLNEIIRARRSVMEKKLKQNETMQTKKMSTIKEIKTEQTKFQLKMSEVSKLLESIICK